LFISKLHAVINEKIMKKIARYECFFDVGVLAQRTLGERHREKRLEEVAFLLYFLRVIFLSVLCVKTWDIHRENQT
jgi:hypothetical protein